MKKTVFFLTSFFVWVVVFAQIPAYYNNVNLTLTGMQLKAELANKITVTHTTQLQYSNVWTVLQQTDLDPANSNNVLLIYGYNDGDGNPTTDRTRSKSSYSGNVGDWNREHVYAKSLATPALVTTSPSAGTDVHHLRSADVTMNNDRGNMKYASGAGNAGPVGANWYPGDEWKGDIARMMMYMYLRYSSQCLPDNVGVGTSVAVDPSMIDLFLTWNAADTVSQYETNRNNILEAQQGNRNPFIDNPYLATLIWGGAVAQDFWNMNGINENKLSNNFTIYPVPADNDEIHVYFKEQLAVKKITLYTVSGQEISSLITPQVVNKEIVFDNLSQGFYLIAIQVGNEVITKKVVVN